MSIQYQIIYWRDIPTHVRVRLGRTRHAQALPEIFQKTVYRAAYRGKAITGDAYEDSWRTGGWLDFDEDGRGPAAQEKAHLLERAAAAIAATLVVDYDEDRLNDLALNKGHDPQAKSAE